MSEGPAKADPLFATTWVHVFEEDGAEGAVYRTEDDATIPLSRRSRQRLKLEPDGSAQISEQGPDDRYVERPATWAEDMGDIVIREGADELRVVRRSPLRLIVRTGKA